MDIVERLRCNHSGMPVHHPWSAMYEAANTIDSLRAQVAALEQDAKRYRWLRDKFTRIGVSAWPDCDDATDGPAVVRELRVMEHFRPTDAASTDAAIDAAMG